MSNTGTFRCVNGDGEHVFENVDSVELYEYARPNGIMAVIWRESPDMSDTQVAALAGIGEFSALGVFVNWSQHVLMVQPHLMHPLGGRAQEWGEFWYTCGLHQRLPTHFPDEPSRPST